MFSFSIFKSFNIFTFCLLCFDEISSGLNTCGVQEIIMEKNINENNILKNGLYIIATPIGNLDDLSSRAISIIEKLDIIVCENPKHSIKLLNKLGIKKKLISLHDYNEEKVIKKIEKYQYNSKIGLISDAGSPLISDPGYNLVKNFIEKEIFITSIPGPSSVISSLQLSGLPINNFTFYGFVPKNKTKERVLLSDLKIKNNQTSIFFISGRNLGGFLENIIKYLGDIEICVCKELTKINEAVYRDKSKIILNKLSKNQINLKGEFTVILCPIQKKDSRNLDDKVEIEISKLLKKYSLTETVQIVHKLTEISKKDIYRKAIEIKNG